MKFFFLLLFALGLAQSRLGAEKAAPAPALSEIEQDLLGGSPLWLRAEPDADAAQADALAAYLTLAIRG